MAKSEATTEPTMGNKRRFTAGVIAAISLLLSACAFYLSNERLMEIQNFHSGMNRPDMTRLLQKIGYSQDSINAFQLLPDPVFREKVEQKIRKLNARYVVNNAVNLYFLFAVWVFLFLWYLANALLDKDPAYLKAGYIFNESESDGCDPDVM
jgi:hypothetical protein